MYGGIPNTYSCWPNQIVSPALDKSSLMQNYRQWLTRAKASGHKLAHYRCPQCRGKLFTLIPPKHETYSSAVLCPHCGGLNHKIVYDNGGIRIGAL